MSFGQAGNAELRATDRGSSVLEDVRKVGQRFAELLDDAAVEMLDALALALDLDPGGRRGGSVTS